jgi:hypothetical protein
MAGRSTAARRRKRRARLRIARWFPAKRTWSRWFRAFRRTPALVQTIAVTIVIAAAWLGLNWTYQVVRKPSELWFPISGALYKTPEQTWTTYGKLFERHSTAVMNPAFLAALAQAEGSGNPVVRTYWRWTLTHRPFDIYRPASSAVGMYQITDATFDEARRYCIHDHRVVEDGPWHAWRSCWFNGLYTRTVPSHAVELTSAYLDRRVAETLARYPQPRATLRQRKELAAVIHLCGAGAGTAFARRGLRVIPGQRCGDHPVRAYLMRLAALEQTFERLAAAD